jgi:hypothetical protein
MITTTWGGRLERGGPRRRDVPVAIAVASLALLAGCTAGSAQSDATPTSSPSASSSGTVSSGNRNGAQGNSGTGTFTLAFARCMRAHGVPDFPDPNGQSGQLGPSSGIDPSSPRFQSAINGPCKSTAPPGWVDSGKVSR